MQLSLDNEQELLQQLKLGNAAVFTQLYEAYSEKLYYATLSMVKDEAVAEELVQHIFTRIWQKRDTIEITENFAGYLYRTGQHTVYDFFRKVSRDKALYEKFAAVSTSAYTHIEEALLRKENAGLLQQMLDILPPQRKKVFQLCKLEGLSYKQAGEVLDISPSTVKDHLVKATKSMQDYLKGHPEIVFFLIILLR